MKKKTRRIMFFVMPVVMFMTLSIFLISGLASGYVSAVSGGGGGLFVGSSSTITIDEGTISGNTATNGGGIYVASGGKVYFGKFFVGDIIEFGSYPKTHQSDTSVITTTQDENGYYLGTDGISRYAKVSANPYVEQYVFYDGTTIVKGTEYYFKVEPIKWRVLSVENGQVLLFCEDIIDARRFNYTNSDRTINGSTIYGNNYKYSDIRAWLNGYGQEEGNTNGEDWSTVGFLQTAFTEEEQNLILTTEVDNSAETTVSSQITYVCENTNDKIFLLSYQDMINTEYGFSSSIGEDTSRQKILTDYAIANNADYYNNYSRIGSYWLRSPYYSIDDHNVFQVSDYLVATSVSRTNIGVVPALYMSETELESCLISENIASNLGGGVYVESGGNLNMTSGLISGNSVTSGNGNNIYNAGTFTMTGGTIGTSGSSQTGYGIYNTGTMNLFGGTIYDNIYSETSFTAKMGANIQGTITLSDSAILTISDYSGTTPALKIEISEEREDGTILKLKGSSVAPDVSKLIIMGKDLCDCKIEVVQVSSTEWNINIKEVLYIRVDENGNEDANGNYVLFGQYPKTVKSDDVEIITSVADSKGYFYGSDGNPYVKVESANPFDPSYTFVDGTTIVSGETYYFKVERIKWRILKESNGQALLLCEDIIDTHQFFGSKENRAVNGEIVYPNNYKYSDVRAWLNGYGQEIENINGENCFNFGFLQKAFSQKTQRIIKITEVDNSASTTDSSSNTYASDEKTNDKIFLLSFQDAVKTSYGFNSDHGVYDSKRKIKTTDYSMVNYIYADRLDEDYCGRWLLRSPASATFQNNLYVSTHGAITHNEWCVEEIIGIAPALTICFNTKNCSHSSLVLTQDEYLQLYENGESIGHYLKKTYECKSCGYSYSEIGDVVDHSCSSTSVVVSDGDSGHHTETTMTCSKCSYIKTVKSETESHSGFSVEKTEWVSVGNLGHYLETTEKCSSCSWTRKIYDDTIITEHNFSPWTIDGEITSIDDTTHFWINHRYCYDCYYVENLSESGAHTYEITNTSVVSNGSSGHCTKTDKKCSGCGHEMSEYSSDVSHILVVKNQTLLKDSSGHYTKIESECEQCHYSCVSYTTSEKHTFETVKTDTISDGSSGHHTETSKKCSVCSYSTTTIGSTVSHSLTITSSSTISDGSSGHHTVTNKKCSNCSYTTTITGSTVSHSLTTTSSSTVSDGSSGHHTETNKKCSSCSYTTTITGSTTDHSLSTSYSYMQFDETYHKRTATTKCSSCSYSTISTKKMMHTLGTDEICSYCGYSPNLVFRSTINSLEIVDEDVFYDDKKKKVGENLFFEDKRNKGNFIFQLPRVGT